MEIRQAAESDVPCLVEIWRRSVEASHDFLTGADRAALMPEVRDAIGVLDVWVADEDGKPVGFMGLDRQRIEALFIDPDWMGKGLGTRLIEYAKTRCGPGEILQVDVNEANPAGYAFYLARGFVLAGRSETDSAGRPWPLLHLNLPLE